MVNVNLGPCGKQNSEILEIEGLSLAGKISSTWVFRLREREEGGRSNSFPLIISFSIPNTTNSMKFLKFFFECECECECLFLLSALLESILLCPFVEISLNWLVLFSIMVFEEVFSALNGGRNESMRRWEEIWFK